MSDLKELEKKYEELGEEIERLKEEEKKKKDGVCADCIFLLSTEEYEKYKSKIPDINCWWWLRSPGYYSNYAAYVSGDSVYDNGRYVSNSYGAVRPALRIIPGQWRLTDTNNRIFRCGMIWIEIDEDLYIAEVPITFRRFDEKSNNYQASEIRQFLLNWCEERANW